MSLTTYLSDKWFFFREKDRKRTYGKIFGMEEMKGKDKRKRQKEKTKGKDERKRKVMVRFAKKEELPKVNELRRQVNDLHVEGRPDIFKPGFSDELKDHIFEIWEDEKQQIVVAEENGEICGFAVLHIIERPENPYMFGRYFLDIDEFCVDSEHRRRGIAKSMISFIKEYAAEQGFKKLELNMWEFNEGALAFYEAAGFKTYRRYMDMDL